MTFTVVEVRGGVEPP